MIERFTISLDQSLAEAFDTLIAQRGYRNRSEAVRDLVRKELESEHLRDEPQGQCVAALSYLYNHHERSLSERLATLQHDHHDLTVSSMHVHLDHDHCIENVMLRGPVQAVRAFAERLIAEPGVRHGHLNLISADVQTAPEQHGHDHSHPHSAQHVHYRPRS